MSLPKKGGFAMATFGQHRVGAGPSHKFIPPTPADGSVIPAVYHAFFGGMFGADFQVRAHIYSPTVRYKQLIRGSFTYNLVPQVHALNAGNLDPVNFIEDGNANGIYGVRGHNVPHLSVYQAAFDVQGRACDLFIGDDTPSDNLVCPSGTSVKIDLTFMGKLIDVAHPHFCYIQRVWHVRGVYVKP
jgi:hypothetical protein